MKPYVKYSLLSLMLFLFIILTTNSSCVESFSIPLATNKHDAFCNTNVGNSNTLNKNCSRLTSDHCKSTSCCVFTSDDKCVAGGEDGATFNTANGKTKKLDYYYFENKCYGEKCPK
uniref:Uncharacterized protein n=1 Tax=viral metagenome TaxID=1070528 RepID=A0A6C0LMS5_9ZZZZ